MSDETDLDERLRDETLKWLGLAEERLEGITCGEERYLENIKAYISDARYFLDQGDLIRSFEAVIWAWAWLEIGLDIHVLETAEERR
ncbi:MAG: DUF357 domain-containing protein [Methanotrichaceae archaeon]|nr:DUF357 domain-containing protein [Methanotrichaceae archaeon]